MLPSGRGDSDWEEVLIGAQVRLRRSRGWGDVEGDRSEFLLVCVNCVSEDGSCSK